MTINAAPRVFAGSTLAPTPTMTDSPAFTTETAYPQLLGSSSIAGSHFEPNTFTSKASPSPVLISATRATRVGPSPTPLDSPRLGVRRASSRRTGRGLSNHRRSNVMRAETIAAVGMTPSQSSHVMPGQYCPTEARRWFRRAGTSARPSDAKPCPPRLTRPPNN